jgi:aldose sugar dehydrogenase
MIRPFRLITIIATVFVVAMAGSVAGAGPATARHVEARALRGPIATTLAAPATPTSVAFAASRVVGNLADPVAFTIAPDGRFFIGERLTGKVKIYNGSTKKTSLFYTVTNLVGNSGNEQGLLGVALHWNYPTRPWVYLYATRSDNGTPYDEILKVIDNNGKGTLKKVIWKSKTVSGSYHDGGRILWEPHGALLAIQGDAHNSSNAQNLSNWAGKVLRMRGDGTVPSDNPIAGSLIYSYGHRNSFGFDIDDETGHVWETENGPECNDEINYIVAGDNYGWGPSETCSTPPNPPANTNQDGPSPNMPITWWDTTIAPTGAAFCFGCHLTNSEGTLFWGSLNDHKIRRAYLDGQRDDFTSYAPVFTHSEGPLSLEVGPNGNIHFSDSTSIWKLIN